MYNSDSAIKTKMILDAIENATGKTISGRDSEDVVKAFGEKLID